MRTSAFDFFEKKNDQGVVLLKGCCFIKRDYNVLLQLKVTRAKNTPRRRRSSALRRGLECAKWNRNLHAI